MLQSLPPMHFSFDYSEFQWTQFTCWGEMDGLDGSTLIYGLPLWNESFQIDETNIVSLNEIQWIHWTSGAQMRSNERCVDSPSVCVCVCVQRCTTMWNRTCHIHQLHHYNDGTYNTYTTRIMNTLTHIYVHTHATYIHVDVFFMNENLTVYGTVFGWFRSLWSFASFYFSAFFYILTYT